MVAGSVVIADPSWFCARIAPLARSRQTGNIRAGRSHGRRGSVPRHKKPQKKDLTPLGDRRARGLYRRARGGDRARPRRDRRQAETARRRRSAVQALRSRGIRGLRRRPRAEHTAGGPGEEPLMLQGKAAVVTGSTSGIGLGIAARACRRGRGDHAQRLRRCRRDRPAEARAAAASRRQGRLFRRRHDEARGDPRRSIADAERELGSVDILVNNAGIQHVAPIENFPDDKWDAIIAINLSAAFHAIKAALPGMKQRGWGRIVNIASAHGLVASAEKAAYVAAKHGIVGLTKVVAIEGRQCRHHLQRDLPGLGADAAGAEADRGARPGEGTDGRAGEERAAGGEAADAAIHHARASGRAGAVSCAATRPRR